MDGHGAINDTARALFAPLGGDYDRWATILSFGQDPVWRRFLVERVPVGPDARVLDVATGTGAIARALVRRYGCTRRRRRPVAADARGRARAHRQGGPDRPHRAAARQRRAIDFEEGSFDALTTGYLLRYLDDPLATMTALLRLVRPGAPFALLDFAVPPNPAARGLWNLYTGVGLPVLGRLVSPGWGDVGRYLRPSITQFGEAYPPDALRDLLVEAGGAHVHTHLLSLGGGIVAWGVRAVR